MALDTKHRSSIYNKLLTTLGEEDASVLMDQFPAVEANELVTKQFLRAELAEIRVEMADLRTDFHTEMRALSNRLMAWSIATMFTGIGLAVAFTRTLG